MRKLIELNQQYLIECDNQRCDFKVPNIDNDCSPEAGSQYIDMSCPKCGWNLLTREDFDSTRRFLRVIHWVNRWFSWLRFFSNKKELQELEVKVHEGIKIKGKK